MNHVTFHFLKVSEQFLLNADWIRWFPPFVRTLRAFLEEFFGSPQQSFIAVRNLFHSERVEPFLNVIYVF